AGTLVRRLSLALSLAAWSVFATALLVVHAQLQRDLSEQTGRQMHAAVERAAADLDTRVAERLRALDAVADQWLRSDRDAGHAAQALAGWPVLASMFEIVVVTDADGRIVGDMPARPERRGVVVAAREYFTRARDSAAAVVGEPYIGRVVSRPLLPFAVALRDRSGRFQGIVMGSVELHGGQLFRDLSAASLGERGRYAVVARGGQLLMHPDPARVLGQLPDRAQDQFAHRAIEGWRGWDRLAAPDGAADGVAAAQPLTQAPWIVIGTLPESESGAALRRLDQVLIAAGLGGALLIALLAALISRGSLAPLARLRREVEAIDAGERSVGVSAEGPAEVARVARAFNRLLMTRERAELALSAREAFHRSLSDGAPLGLLLIDDEAQCTYANQGALALTGRSFETLCGAGWRACLHDDDAGALSAAWHRARARRAPFELTVRLVRPDRSTAWTLLRATPLTEGGQTMYLAALLDVTAERAAREAAQRAHAHAQTILDTIQDALFVVDARGRVSDLSPAAERMCGWTRAQAVGVPLGRVVRLIDETDAAVAFDAFGTLMHFASERWQVDGAEGRGAVDIVWRRFGDGGGTDPADSGGVLTLRDARERRAAAQATQWAATHDALTGLPNRRAFDTALDRAHAVFSAGGDNSALLMLDLDGFKAVNDGAGHEAGDAMLGEVAQVLRAQVRTSDLAARIGGDEFAVLLAGCTEVRAAAIAEGIREAIGRIALMRDGRRYGIGVSIGVSSFVATDDSADCPLRRADAATYKAKRIGRNRVALADRPEAPLPPPGASAQCGRGNCSGCEAEAACAVIRVITQGRAD
nr:diguanylate cyclase [Burkholderiaceae bacterium]